MKYWAFISYSHTDKRWGDWLHRALETYRVPRRLVGHEVRDGKIPERIIPVFRDREELPVSSDLSTNINQALEESRYLIVICSPRSAQSRWVGEEIKTFKRLGRENRILALIVEGSPNASDGRPEVSPEAECFHQAMRYRMVDGVFSDIRTEPVAGDAREGRDGRNNAKLKLIAGILGVNYDELKQREHERRLRRARTITAVAVSLIAAFAAMTIALFFKQREATRARDEAQIQSERRGDLLREAAQSDRLRGDEYFSRGNQPGGFAYLARAIRYDPATTLAAEKMFAELNNWRFHPVEQLFPHEAINTAHFSPDGKYIVTASDDKTVKIWLASGGHPPTTIEDPDDAIIDAFFTADGQRVATITAGSKSSPPWSEYYYNVKILRVWERESGKLLTTFRFPENAKAVQIDRLGRYTLSISEDSVASVWDILTGTCVSILPGIAQGNAKLSPNGQRLIVEGSTGVCLRDSRGGLLRKAEKGNSAQFEADGRWVACYFPDHAELWDAQSGQSIGSVRIDPDNRSGSGAAHFSRDGKMAVTVWPDGTARISQITGTTAVVELRFADALDPESARANSTAAFSADGKKVLTVRGDGETYVWDALDGQMLAHVKGLSAHWATFSPDGKMVLAFPEDAKVVPDSKRHSLSAALYSAETGQLLTKSQFPGTNLEFSPDCASLLRVAEGAAWLLSATPLNSAPEITVGSLDRVAFSSDDSKLLTSGEIIRVWDSSTGALLKAFPHSKNAQFVCGDRYIVGFAPSVARVWDAMTGDLLFDFPISDQTFASPHINCHPERLVTLSGRTAEIRDLRTGYLITTIELSESTSAESWERLHIVMLSPDGKQLLDRFDQSVELWDLDTKSRSRRLDHPSRVGQARFSPDGSRVLTSCNDLIPRIWDARSGRLLAALQPLTPASQSASGFDYSPSGDYILSSADPPSLWNAHTYRFIGHLEGFMRGFASGERRIITEGQDYSDAIKGWFVKIWDTRTCTPTAELRTNSGNVEALSSDGQKVIISHMSYADPNPKTAVRSELLKKLYLWSILNADANPPPSWVVDFLHYLAQERLNSAGELEPIPVMAWLEMRQQLQELVRKNHSATDPYNRMLRRFVSVD